MATAETLNPAALSAEAGRLALSAREAFRRIRRSPSHVRNAALLRLADSLETPENIRTLLSENEKDVRAGAAGGLSTAMIDRLTLTEKRIRNVAASVREIAAFPDPVGEVLSGGTLKSGVEMVKKRVPLGVIFVIYESRPNVTVDVGALAVKSGNAGILRGGKEAIHSNTALFKLFAAALEAEGIGGSLCLVENTDRALMTELLQRDDLIDLVVPRGGEALIKYVAAESRIPVVKHDRGVCNMYVDASAEADMTLRVAVNAKLQRPSVCNAIENLLIHQKYPHTLELLTGLAKAGAEILGCEETRKIFPEAKPMENPDETYAMEFLDGRLAVKIVTGIPEAVDFIYKYGSAHSEAIMARDNTAIDEFIAAMDSAAVFVNCSTRFHDGGEMGMGAEVGISTARLHVRGPMGVKDLTTTTYIVRGRGEVRG